jgi:magnesium chelatase subunit D
VLDAGSVTLQREGLSQILPTRFGIVALDEGAEPDERPPAKLLDRMAFHLDLTEVSTRDIDDPAWTAADLAAARGILRASISHQPALPSAHPSWRAKARHPRLYGAASTEGIDGGPLSLRQGHASPAMTGLGLPVGQDQSGQVSGPGPDGLAIHATGAQDQLLDPGENSEPDPAEALCGAAMSLGIDSIRAPLLALRAARVAAALNERLEPDETDLGLAARLVFASRATRFPPPRESEQPEPQPEAEQPEPPPPQDDPSTDPDTLPDQPLADIVLEAAVAALPPDLLAKLAQQDGGRGQAGAAGRATETRASTKRGRPIGTRQGEPKNGNRLHVLETLKTAAPWQTLRRRSGDGPTRFEVRREDFRIIRFRQRIGTTTIFAVDASGSAAMQRLGEAKGAVELLLADCYVRRDQVALIAFRGQGAQVLLPPTGSLLRAKRSLAGLPGGGPTPLAAGIDAAIALADTIRRSGRTPVITILTDARANIGRDGAGGRPRAEAEALESAAALRAAGYAALLVDTSPRPNPFAKRLAEAMKASYTPLPYADASALSRAARAAAA